MSGDWLAEGVEAVILQPWDLGALMARSVTVDRLTKRDVVLADGSRWRRDRLEKRTGEWSPTLYLVPPTDPRVTETRAKIRTIRLRFTAQKAYEAWRQGGPAGDVIAAFKAVRGDEVDR